MKYIVEIRVREQGFWGFIKGLFSRGWYREIQTENHQPGTESVIMDLIDSRFS